MCSTTLAIYIYVWVTTYQIDAFHQIILYLVPESVRIDSTRDVNTLVELLVQPREHDA